MGPTLGSHEQNLARLCPWIPEAWGFMHRLWVLTGSAPARLPDSIKRDGRRAGSKDLS